MYYFFKSSLQKDIIIPTTPEVYFLFVCLSLTYDLAVYFHTENLSWTWSYNL